MNNAASFSFPKKLDLYACDRILMVVVLKHATGHSNTMGSIVEQLASQALSLPPGGRAFLAEKLLESLDAGDDFAVSAEWREEIGRRVKEIDTEKVQLLNSDQVFDEAFESLAK